MFPISDPTFHLELEHQRAASLQREAAAYRLAREASAAGRHRHGWHRSRRARHPQPVQAPVGP
jgi:hypothetical protein